MNSNRCATAEVLARNPPLVETGLWLSSTYARSEQSQGGDSIFEVSWDGEAWHSAGAAHQWQTSAISYF